MRVLMLGWEFPPHFAGGVGVVCQSLTRALGRRGVEVTYLMPVDPDGVEAPGVRLLGALARVPGLRVSGVPARVHSYAEAGSAWRVPGESLRPPARTLYGPDLLEEVRRFSAGCLALAPGLGPFDVIHAHDWTTFPAGVALRRATGRPLVVHVHITEFDKSGGSGADGRVYEIERTGIQEADRVVAVSQRVADALKERYGADPARIRVVHNAVETDPRPTAPRVLPGPLILYLGRVTLQKGPEYFLEAARRVLDVEPETTFVLAGNGDMLPRMIERSAELGIGRHMLFPGFVDRDRTSRLYDMADLFVMPSVSEPFGIVALEAMERGVPVIVSRQSGVGELLRSALRVDFWDVEQLADRMIALLRYRALHRELRERGRAEASRITWDGVAEKTETLYREVCHA